MSKRVRERPGSIIARTREPDLTDPANPEWTEADFARAQPPEAFPDLMAVIKRGKGRPPKDAPKIAVSLRLDREIVERYRATGPGWQARINDDLAKASERR